MKSLLLITFLFTTSVVLAQTEKKKAPLPDSTKKMMLVEASCGECKFGMKGSSCDLAVRIDGKSYFVDGTSIDSHGDAHSTEGFCKAIRQAEVQGTIVKDRFKATYFKLLPAKE